MLQIDKVQQLHGITVFGDSDPALFNKFYPLPQQPRYRVGPDGRLSFGYYKYKYPVDRPGGVVGGAFLLFDVEFIVDPAALEQIRVELAAQVTAEANRRGVSPVPDVVIGDFTFTKGESALIYPSNFVEKEVPNGSTPSLYGTNISTFALELTQEGATFFEQAMQGNGGAVSVIYKLWFYAQLPETKITASFSASKFYSFYQTIDTDWNLWSEDSYRETVRESMISSESMTFTPEWGGLTDEKVKGQLRDWAMRTLEKAIERNMIEAIAPVPDDQRKLPDGIEDVTRDISSVRIASFDLTYKEKQTVEWFVAPRGILPNITSLKDGNGAPIKWSDYARVIDLDDPFFKQLRVDTFVNADFKNLPIHSVEVKLLYKGRPMANLAEGEPDGEIVLNTEQDVGKFATYVEGDDWKYIYSYQINYRGVGRQYQSPDIETNEGNLTIGVDDVGILNVEATAGDLNWTELDRAMVVLSYEDQANGVEPLEESFVLTQATPDHQIQRVIFQPLRNNYKYRIKYFMKNGREYQGSEQTGRSQRLFVNDVFDARRTVMVSGVGDFATRIQTIFVDLEYADQQHDYKQTKSQALTASTQFFEWSFPVIDDKAGIVSYRALIAYKDGTSERIPPENSPNPWLTAGSNTIILPPSTADFLSVDITTDLLDWTQVRLVRVSMSYADPVNDVSQAKDFVFSPSNKASTTWKVPIKDKQKIEYSYSVSYFLVGGLKKDVPTTKSRDRTLILDHTA